MKSEKKSIIHGAAVLIVRKDGTVLIQHRDDKPDIAYPDHWGYPGGIVEADEGYEEAAVRELTEETSYRPETVIPLIEENYERYDGQIIRRHTYWTLYDEQQEIICNEGQEMRFMYPEDLGDKKTLPGQIEVMKKAIEAAQNKTS